MALGAILAGASPAGGERLSLRTYRVVDGLTTGQVQVIHQDLRGYVWVGTGDGLSRFDGRRFVRYGEADGLPSPAVTGIAEDAQGRVWVATYRGGLARLEESGSRPFSAVVTEPAEVLAVSVADDGTVYWLSEAGLHRGRESGSGLRSELLLPRAVLRDALSKPQYCRQAVRDAARRLWFGLADSVVAVTAAGLTPHASPSRQRGQPVLGLAALGDAGLLVVYPTAAFQLNGSAGREPVWTPLRPLPRGVRLAGAAVRTRDGSLHLATSKGLLVERSGRWRHLTRENGLPGEFVHALAVDTEGGLWIGAEYSLSRMSGQLSWSLGTADGLPKPVHRIAEGADSRIYVSWDGGIAEIADGRAEPVPGAQQPAFRDAGPRVLCDRRDNWWVGTNEALYRFEGPRLQLRKGRRFGAAEGLPAGVGHNGLYQDPDGVLWVADREGHIYRSDAEVDAASVFHRLPVRSPDMGPVLAMVRDAAGALWVSDVQHVTRFHDGRWTTISPGPGLPTTNVRALHSDASGRLWLALRFNGVSVSEDPRSPIPRFRNYSERDGLLSDAVRALAEDAYGRLYFGTARGVSRLDPASGAWRHFSGHDLAGDRVERLLVDRGGSLWVSANGLTKLNVGGRDEAGPHLRAYVVRLRAGGTEVRLPTRGVVSMAELTVPSSGDVAVEFTVPLFEPETARFQYRLEGGGDAGWSPPQGETAVNYARLAPGRYRFSVRALDAEGRPGLEPAVISFRVLAPLWRRPWFQAGVGLLLAGLVFGGYRMRLRRLLALERLRRQIATDLHDDIGSGLTQIAVLSEVARREVETAPARMEGVAGLARSLRESMSDIVWAVDPRRDRLADMVNRMREAAFNLAEADGIRVDFDVPPDEDVERVGLTPDQKRHLFLAFKEAMNNVARHSGASQVTVSLALQHGRLTLGVRDDGRGFDPQVPTAGLGLGSLRRRAAEVGGTLEIESAAGEGTRLRLSVPVRS